MTHNTYPAKYNRASAPATVRTTMGEMAMGLAQSLNTDPVIRGEHTSQYLRQPMTTAYGIFDKRVAYTQGCVPAAELQGQTGEHVSALMLVMNKPDNRRQMVVLGETPASYDPSKGGKPVAGAGRPAEYLAAIYNDAGAGDHEPDAFRYVSEAQLAGVRAQHEQPLRLNVDPTRQELQITGIVAKTYGLIDTQQTHVAQQPMPGTPNQIVS